MQKKILFFFIAAGALVCILQGCGQKPFACITIEGNQDSIHVHQPVTINGYCSSGANEFNWLINNDSVYFTPRFTIIFNTPGEQEIYLLVSSNKKAAGATKKLIVYP